MNRTEENLINFYKEHKEEILKNGKSSAEQAARNLELAIHLSEAGEKAETVTICTNLEGAFLADSSEEQRRLKLRADAYYSMAMVRKALEDYKRLKSAGDSREFIKECQKAIQISNGDSLSFVGVCTLTVFIVCTTAFSLTFYAVLIAGTAMLFTGLAMRYTAGKF
jgi:hypothetical protein